MTDLDQLASANRQPYRPRRYAPPTEQRSSAPSIATFLHWVLLIIAAAGSALYLYEQVSIGIAIYEAQQKMHQLRHFDPPVYP